MTTTTFGHLTLTVDENHIGTVIFDRPPVNAVSYEVYGNLGDLVDHVEKNEDIKVLILSAPDKARAWCGGADLNDFVGIDTEGRKARYRFINEKVPGLYHLDRPIIAAINGPAIGIGMILAGLCDMRIAAEDAVFACPEVDYGLVGGGAGLFWNLNMPEAKIREMLFTGRKYTARELEPTGFFNYVVPREAVYAKAMELATLISTKSARSLKARKIASTSCEGKGWMESYLFAQSLSADLVAHPDASEGVEAFLEKRKPHFEA